MTGQDNCYRNVTEWLELIRNKNDRFAEKLDELYAGDGQVKAESAAMYEKAVETFAEAFGADREVMLVHSTGRVNLLGMHVDHRGGSVNPIAIKEMILVVEPRDDDMVVLRNVESDKFPDEQFRISDCIPKKKLVDWDQFCHDELDKRKDDQAVTWSNYIRAGVLYLQHRYTSGEGEFAPAFKGMNIVMYGNIPLAAGLSSSSSLVLVTCETVMRVNGLEMDPMELVEGSGYAEWYVGTRGGCGDQAAIRFGKAGQILHMTNFPLTVESAPFPEGYTIVLANSMVVAKKRTGAKNTFNSRVAAYVFGLLMVRKNFPQYAGQLEHIRDINPAKLGVDEAEIYRILKTLPERCDRAEVLRRLPWDEEEIRQIFRSHDEPAEGYKIRQVCMYGIAECIRADMVPGLLRDGDIKGFGELMNISHEGDRVTELVDGRRVEGDYSYPDEKLDCLLADLESGEPECMEGARLWRQCGGYDVSVPEMDTIVDIALTCDGVAGAGLVGAGMGGSVAILVEKNHAEALIERLADGYYRANDLPVKAEIVSPIAGACVIEV